MRSELPVPWYSLPAPYTSAPYKQAGAVQTSAVQQAGQYKLAPYNSQGQYKLAPYNQAEASEKPRAWYNVHRKNGVFFVLDFAANSTGSTNGYGLCATAGLYLDLVS